MSRIFSPLALGMAGLATALVAIFGFTVARFEAGLREEIHAKIVERDAAVLHPVALQQLAESQARERPSEADPILHSVLKSAAQQGMLAITVFDAEGNTLRSLPATLVFPELPAEDYLRLSALKPISRYHPRFPLDKYFGPAPSDRGEAPVLEVLLPLHSRDAAELLGFAQYFIDARPLARELAAIDRRLDRQARITLTSGGTLIVVIVGLAYFGLRRAHRQIDERNEGLRRANFELTLSAKASALGQITSHLLHGLQGSVAGLRAAVTPQGLAATSTSDWQSAADYADRVQAIIQETVALLGDAQAGVSYELTGRELAATIRDRNAPAARAKGVNLIVGAGFPACIDSHRGSLLCLIATNLVQNSIAATAPGDCVEISLQVENGRLLLRVTDDGPGIPPEIRSELFTPGRSGRDGGTGLGLAISRLLARQIDATLSLDATGPEGTVFSLSLLLTP